ncbi:MAG: hypothetical protein U9Q80_04095, partial [Bacillota bacterium]|nr:hypothetical protein [Bacillota bacterium]
VESTDESMITTLLNKSFDKKDAKEIQIVLKDYYKKYPNEFAYNRYLSEVRRIINMIIYDDIYENESYDEFSQRK